MMNSKNYDEKLVRWQKLQVIGETKVKKLGFDTEEKIVENLQITEPRDFIKTIE